MHYYRDGTHSVGPFSEEKLLELHSKGIINDQSLVRSADSDAWFEYSKLSSSAVHALHADSLSDRIELSDVSVCETNRGT